RRGSSLLVPFSPQQGSPPHAEQIPSFCEKIPYFKFGKRLRVLRNHFHLGRIAALTDICGPRWSDCPPSGTTGEFSSLGNRYQIPRVMRILDIANLPETFIHEVSLLSDSDNRESPCSLP